MTLIPTSDRRLRPSSNLREQPSPDSLREGIWRKNSLTIAIAVLTATFTFFVTDYLNRPKLAVHIVKIEQAGVDVYQFSAVGIIGLLEFFTDQPAVSDAVTKVEDPGVAGSAMLRSMKIGLSVSAVTKGLEEAKDTMKRVGNARSEFQVAKQMSNWSAARDALVRWNQDKIITSYIPDAPAADNKDAISSAVDQVLEKLDKITKIDNQAIETVEKDLASAQELAKRKNFRVKILIVNGGNSAAAVTGLGLLRGDSWNLVLRGNSEAVAPASEVGVDAFAVAPHQSLSLIFKSDVGQTSYSTGNTDIASQQFLSGGLGKCRFNLLTSADKVIVSEPFPFGGGDRYIEQAVELLRSNVN